MTAALSISVKEERKCQTVFQSELAIILAVGCHLRSDPPKGVTVTVTNPFPDSGKKVIRAVSEGRAPRHSIPSPTLTASFDVPELT